MLSKKTTSKRVSAARFTLKTISVAVMSAWVVANANAAGLGRLTVLSALGQPLRAEIELTAVSREEVGQLTAKLASAEAFRQANLDFNPALQSLRFDVETRGERQVIRVTSTQSLNEPFVDMLLELSGPHGRLIREYTFLLDPPELRPAQAPSVAPSAVPELGAAGTQSAPSPQRPMAPAPLPSSARDAVPAKEAVQSEVEVHRGDTLTRIATRLKPAGVSLDQMLVALYQSNPHAFVSSNMNRLKAGQILSVPSAEAAASVDTREARKLIVTQAADFNAYRQRLAGQVASASAQASATTGQGASGRITARVEERSTPLTEAQDRLELTHAGTKAQGPSMEDLIASEKARAEAEARIKELEKTVSDLQKLLELKSAGLSAQQQQAEAAQAPDATAESPAAADEAQSAAAKPASAAAKPAPAKPAPVQPAPPPPAPSGFLDELISNPMTLPGLGLVLAALAGLGIYRMRRQKHDKGFEDSILTDTNLKTNSLFGSTGGQSVDTNNSVFNSSFTPSVSQLDSNEVDPVAEADVYIAYGRDAQAEEILKEALRMQPDRHSVRLKLLEIYSNRKDLRAFEVMATELYGMTRGEGDEWAQAAAMGVVLDSNNPLYAGTAETEESVDDTPAQEAQGWSTLLSESQGDTASFASESQLEAEKTYFDTEAPQTEGTLDALAQGDGEQAPKSESNELEFDLSGMDLGLEVPNTMPRPATEEPAADLTAIDFDFLDIKTPAAGAEPGEQEQVDAVPSLDDLEQALNELAPQANAIPDVVQAQADSPADFQAEAQEAADAADATGEALPEGLDLDIGGFELPPLAATSEAAAEAQAEERSLDDALGEEDAGQGADAAGEPEPMDFDLSGISLELEPAADTESLEAESLDFSSADEMATKLDLAIAYQEIGDKEGARELLDEVLKGGTPEQSEKARSLLLELA